MSFTIEGRASDSPYVEMIWRGQAGRDCSPICFADGRWNLALIKENGKMQAFVTGPMTRASIVSHTEGTEWLTIKFKLGTYLPHLPTTERVDTELNLPETARQAFWLKSSAWELPDFENADTFVDRLVHEGLLVRDDVVDAVMQDDSPALSIRSVRRRFLRVTGLTQSTVRQIERAHHAAALLEQGVSILDAVFEAGYFDQPHMTRALKYYMGQTPAQIARLSSPE